MFIYWRCARCNVIERTSPLTDGLMHTHTFSNDETGRFSLLACRTLTEAKGLRPVKYRSYSGLRKLPKGKLFG